jgi:hypothetical protein
MRAEIIKYPMGALTAEGALIYDENVSGKRPPLRRVPHPGRRPILAFDPQNRTKPLCQLRPSLGRDNISRYLLWVR